MSEATIQVDLPLIFADETMNRALISDLMVYRFSHWRGILKVHIKDGLDPPQLCLHYDPNLISFTAVQRLVNDSGSDLPQQYQVDRIPFRSRLHADAVTRLESQLDNLPGILQVRVSYASGQAFVAYDAQVAKPPFRRIFERIGYKVLPILPESGGRKKAAGTEKTMSKWQARRAWFVERWPLIQALLAGLFFLIGWLGARTFGLTENQALFFFILSYISGGFDVARHAIPGLLKGQFDTDVLMLAAAFGAAALGQWAEGAFLLFLFSLAHAGEHYALDRARDAVNSLGELMPKTAHRRQGDEISEIPVEDLAIDDVVVVRPGERIPVDGTIARGRSTVDLSAITGESVPEPRAPGDGVFAGTINQESVLDVTVTTLAQDNTLNRIMQMVAEAQSQQSPTQQFTQRFMAKFVPAILIVVALVIVVPPLLGWLPLSESFYRAMILLVGASPCALALGTPAAVLAGTARAARNGVLIKGGVHLENLGMVKVMAFDKTGTLTTGKFQVTDLLPHNGIAEAALLQLAAAVEQQSTHPLAQAVYQAAESRALAIPAAEGLDNIAGKGVRSVVDGRQVLIGSRKLFAGDETLVESGLLAQIDALEAAGKTTMLVQVDGDFWGILALADAARPQAREMLEQLRQKGIEALVMLTGDHEQVARRIANKVGIDEVQADLLPEEKLNAIQALEARYGKVAMTGDGVNDAPALATATVGIAMGGTGTAVALETADVALMGDDLNKLPFAVGLSRASRRIIMQNLVIALGVIGILTLASLTGALPLSVAVVFHEGSTIVVVLNALRLLRYQER